MPEIESRADLRVLLMFCPPAHGLYADNLQGRDCCFRYVSPLPKVVTGAILKSGLDILRYQERDRGLAGLIMLLSLER
jgi:hypothetical protein